MRSVRTLLVLTVVLVAIIIPARIGAADGERFFAAQGREDLDTDGRRYAVDGRFIADDNGVITDTKTGLEWFEGPALDTNWDEAKSWVESLPVAGGGWRMPTRDELKSLYLKSSGIQRLTPFFRTNTGFIWTGETMGSTHAWGFCLDIGDEYWPRRTFSSDARGFAVRSKRP